MRPQIERDLNKKVICLTILAGNEPNRLIKISGTSWGFVNIFLILHYVWIL